MDVMIRLNIPKAVYEFYKGAAVHVSGRTAETLMAEVLCTYAKTLSKEVREDLAKDKK